MVKADTKRDYYADLDLPPTADAEDIKKQFRALGENLSQMVREIELITSSQAVPS